MKKTFLCFSLSFALLASALNPLFSADVFAKAKLAKTKITLTVGQKKKITIKGKKKKAKQKGVLECPHYRSIFIDEVLANLPKGEVC